MRADHHPCARGFGAQAELAGQAKAVWSRASESVLGVERCLTSAPGWITAFILSVRPGPDRLWRLHAHLPQVRISTVSIVPIAIGAFPTRIVHSAASHERTLWEGGQPLEQSCSSLLSTVLSTYSIQFLDRLYTRRSNWHLCATTATNSPGCSRCAQYTASPLLSSDSAIGSAVIHGHTSPRSCIDAEPCHQNQLSLLRKSGTG